MKNHCRNFKLGQRINLIKRIVPIHLFINKSAYHQPNCVVWEEPGNLATIADSHVLLNVCGGDIYRVAMTRSSITNGIYPSANT